MSKLIVPICKIEKISPIEGADKIVLAEILGWQCIIQKDTFKVGGVCIFIPPDAVLPEELIEKQKLTYLKGQNRIRTIKLKGVVSQGLVLSVDVLNLHTWIDSFNNFRIGNNYTVGSDVAKDLGITKYEPPQNTPGVHSPTGNWKKWKELFVGLKEGKVTVKRFITITISLIKDYFKPKKKVNSNFDIYTDLDNIKNYPTVFEEGEEVVITEKVHGTNFRAGTLPLNQTFLGRIKKLFTGKDYEFCYGSHRVQKTIVSGNGFYGEDVYGRIAKEYNLKDIIPPDYIIYGEIYGNKIQELTYGQKDIAVVFFDVKYKGKYLDFSEFYNFCITRNLPIVPILYEGKFNKDSLKYTTEGNSTLPNTHHIREGCVVKPLKEFNHPRCGRKILKSISTDYLLSKQCKDNEEYIH